MPAAPIPSRTGPGGPFAAIMSGTAGHSSTIPKTPLQTKKRPIIIRSMTPRSGKPPCRLGGAAMRSAGR